MFGSNKNDYYFNSFIEQCEYTCEITEKTKQALDHYEKMDISREIEEIHRIEHNADLKQHEIFEKLTKEFMAPIEREDIVALAQALDNLTDSIEDILTYMYTYNVKKVREETFIFMDVINSSVLELKKLLTGFHDFKHNRDYLMKSIVEINRQEEVGDRIYHTTLREMFCDESLDGRTVLIWKEMYDRLEKVLDTTEDIANMVESIIMKNT